MERLIDTELFGEVKIRNAIIDSDGTNLIEGTVIECDDFGVIELHETYDLEEITSSKVNAIMLEHLPEEDK